MNVEQKDSNTAPEMEIDSQKLEKPKYEVLKAHELAVK
jgi:hypothetical protein